MLISGLGWLNFFTLSWLLILGIVPFNFGSGFMWTFFFFISLWVGYDSEEPQEKQEDQDEDSVGRE